MGKSKGPLLAYSSKWPAQTQAGSLLMCPMDPEQAMAQVDKATYVPMAMICACPAAQAPADTQPMYLNGPWQCQYCH
jgi:hypothetical protein